MSYSFTEHSLCSDQDVKLCPPGVHKGEPYHNGEHPVILPTDKIFSYLSLSQRFFFFTGVS